MVDWSFTAFRGLLGFDVVGVLSTRKLHVDSSSPRCWEECGKKGQVTTNQLSPNKYGRRYPPSWCKMRQFIMSLCAWSSCCQSEFKCAGVLHRGFHWWIRPGPYYVVRRVINHCMVRSSEQMLPTTWEINLVQFVKYVIFLAAATHD